MIIEIEGIDGVGKTTQCELLKERLKRQGRNAIIVKDLESTELGRGIKEVLVSSASRPPEVELFSFLACKSQLFSQIVIPTIADGGIVICDRGVGSFVSYFESVGFPKPFLLHAIGLAINSLRPNITILLDVTVEEATRRKANKSEQSKFDLMGSEFFKRQRSAFLDLSTSPSWVVIDGSLSIEATRELVARYVESIVS